VAVLLGAIFLGEPLTVGILFAATIILGSVAMTVLDGSYRDRASHELNPAARGRVGRSWLGCHRLSACRGSSSLVNGGSRAQDGALQAGLI